MNHTHTNRRRAAVTALAAFGVATLGVIGVARADDPRRDRDRDGLVDRYEDDRGYQYDDYDEYQVGPYGAYQGDVVETDAYVELDRYAPALDFDRHAHIDFRHYDRNRNGRLDSWERQAYWKHLAEMGVFGRRQATNAIAGLAKNLDRDGDGRLTRREHQLVRRFIAARRMFEQQDWNNDDHLGWRESTGWLRTRFTQLDRNRDRFVTRSEVKRFFINLDQPQPRTWSWNWQLR